MIVHIDILTLEPGTHHSRKTIGRKRLAEVELPLEECQEVRPDWGEYLPITTFPAIERALKRRGHFTPLYSRDEQYQFGILSE